MKRVRFNGRALSKFDMAYEMGFWHDVPWDKVCDVLSYEDIAERFVSYCRDKGLTL